MLSILLTSNFPLLETSLLVQNKKLLSPMLAYYFGFTNIRFLSTNIGILFCFCFSWIPPYQYWHIIFVLPTLHCSKPIFVYYFLFTNVGFLYTIIGKLFSFYQHWFHLYQNWYIVSFLPILISSLPILAYYLGFFLPMLDPSLPLLVYFLCFANVGIYNIFPTLVCHLLIPKINQTYANKKHTISQCLNLKFFPVLVSHTFWHTTKNGLRWI